MRLVKWGIEVILKLAYIALNVIELGTVFRPEAEGRESDCWLRGFRGLLWFWRKICKLITTLSIRLQPIW